MNQPNPVSDLGVEFILGPLFWIASVWGVWMPAGSTLTHESELPKLTLPAWALRAVAQSRLGCVGLGKIVRKSDVKIVQVHILVS
ncbi:hypothetical protein NEUTE2DRAFT_123365 [Neurospora tetrasperma FGSC 2509]|nr:hypothetical protein NEUTE2DRAFT_123365 [Neurospora tetrasperma FGSC 2509]